MPLQVFNPAKDQGRHAWMDYSYQDELPVELLRQGGPWKVKGVELDARSRRTYRWPAGMDEAQRLTWQAFLEAVGWTRDAFLVRDPRDDERTGVTLEPAVGDGSTTTFSLPTVDSSPEYRHHPLSLATSVGYVAGAPAGLASVDTDARTVTFSAAPGVGLAVTADYVGLRLVRLREAPEAGSMEVDWLRYELALDEVLRDDVATGAAFYGDLALWQQTIGAPVEQTSRRILQVHDGVDQVEALVLGASSNMELTLLVRCLGFPNPASGTTKGWLAVSRKLRRELWDRSLRQDPLVWVQDTSRSRVVQSYSAPTVTTTAPHGLTTGDTVLVRRPGAGSWLVVAVTVTGASTFTLAGVPAGLVTDYEPQATDDVHLVEAWWASMVLASLAPMEGEAEGGRWYAKEVLYGFRGSGRYSWAATDASAVGA